MRGLFWQEIGEIVATPRKLHILEYVTNMEAAQPLPCPLGKRQPVSPSSRSDPISDRIVRGFGTGARKVLV